MTKYDQSLGRDRADQLYGKARFLVYVHALSGFFLGLLLAFSWGAVIAHDLPMNLQMLGLTAIICGIVGGIHGHVKAGELRLKAQRIICGVQTDILNISH